MELWKDIDEFEGKYQISNLGNVMSLNYRNSKKPGLLQQYDDKDGYKTVQLFLNGQMKVKKVHRLVGIAFLSNPDNLPEINHKDENKANNCVDNLEWCDRAYNNCYGNRINKTKKPVLCVELNTIYSSQQEAANALSISQGSISKCCAHPTRRAGGYHWRFVEEKE